MRVVRHSDPDAFLAAAMPMAALSRELLARGKRKLFLTTYVANPTPNAICAKIGYRAESEDCGFDFIVPGA